MRRAVGIVSICVLGGSAVAQQQPPRRTQEPEQQPPATAAPDPNARQAPARPAQPGSGRRSLFKAALAAQGDPRQAKMSDVSFFSVPEPEPKTLKKHDQVTIIVREESTTSSNGSAEFKKEAEFEARLDEFINLKLKNWEIEGGGIGPTAPSIKASGKRDFKGEGSVDRQDRFNARIQAEVVDVKPNGTLVVQARKRIRTDDEEQVFTLSGIARVEDVNADNTILSTQLADLDIEKKSSGTVRNATRRGWIPKLLDAINPF